MTVIIIKKIILCKLNQARNKMIKIRHLLTNNSQLILSCLFVDYSDSECIRELSRFLISFQKIMDLNSSDLSTQ